MKTVWKYEIPSAVKFSLPLPQGAEVIAVQTQRGQPCVWVKVDTEHPVEPRNFEVVGTGNPIESQYTRYAGTFQLMGDELVFHLFEVI